MNVNSFQGVTCAQQELVEVWRELASRQPSGLARKCDLDPGVLRQHLSRISLLDIRAGQEPHFRLSGSRLTAMLGLDPTGKHLSELPAPHGDIFALGLEPILSGQGPVGGVVSLEAGGAVQVWLRLPLADETGQLRFVLCHDDVITPEEQAEAGPFHGAIHIEELSIAA